MKAPFLLLLFLCCTGGLFAQNNQYTSAKDSDPEAVKLLDGIRKKYDAYGTLQADVQLIIELPGQQPITQSGRVSRKADNVRFKLGDQEGIINGEAAYLIQHANREVMINNLPEAGEMNGVLTPQTLFNFYEGAAFVLAIDGEETIGGRKLTAVLLKPVDRDNSEFTKMRLLVDAAKKEIVSVKAFSRDGTRYAFQLNETRGDVPLAAGTFVFDKKEFPNYHVEDLRY